jgi:hypothetical protein
MSISVTQSKAVIELVLSTTLTHVECCEVLAAAARVQWATEEHFEAVSAALTQQVETPPAKRARRQQQDFASFMQYGTARFWAVFNGDTTAPTSRLSLLCQHLVKLGLRCPSESTFKAMTSVWLVATHARGDLWNIDTQAKLTFMRHVKSTFDGYRRKAAEPQIYIDVLPADATQYLRDYREMWDSAFGESLPEPCPLDFSVIAAFDGSYGCRGGATGRHATCMPEVVRQQCVVGTRRGDDGPMERFVSQMHDMQMNQHRLLEFVLKSQQGTGLQALSFGLHRRPSLALSSSSQLAEEVSDSSPPRQLLALPGPEPAFARSLSADSLATRTDAVAAESGPGANLAIVPVPPLGGSSAGSSGGVALDPVSSMLDAYEARRRLKIVTARKAAMEVKVEAKVPVPAKAKTHEVVEAKVPAKAKTSMPAKAKVPATAETPMPAKATAKAKAPMLAKAKVLANAKTPVPAKAAETPMPVNAKADTPMPAKAYGEAMALGKPPVLAKVKAKADAAAGKARSSAIAARAKLAADAVPGGLVYGCCKCRYKSHGCAQCWNPLYKGRRGSKEAA